MVDITCCVCVMASWTASSISCGASPLVGGTAEIIARSAVMSFMLCPRDVATGQVFSVSRDNLANLLNSQWKRA